MLGMVLVVGVGGAWGCWAGTEQISFKGIGLGLGKLR